MRHTTKANPYSSRAVLSIVCSLIIAAAPLTAYADSGTIGGRPANPDSKNARTESIFIKTIQPGKSAKDAVIVINNTDQKKIVSVYATDSTSSSGGAFACEQASETPHSVGKWIALEKTQLELAANSTKKVSFTIAAPKDSEPGEQNGCIVLQEKKTDSFKGGISLNFRTAIRVAIMIPGEIHKELTLLAPQVRQRDENITVSPSVKNTGNVSIDTDIKTSLKTIFGSTIQTQTNTYPVLRDQVADWNFDLDSPFWGGLYSASYQALYDESDAFLDKGDGSHTKTLSSKSVTFIVAPHPLAGIIEVLVFCAIISAFWLYRRGRLSKVEITEKWSDYTIKLDDDIQLIAKRYRIDWKRLARANKIKAPYTLFEGKTLRVPPKKAVPKNQPTPKT